MSSPSLKDCVRELARRHADFGASQLYSTFQTVATQEFAPEVDTTIGFHKFTRLLREIRQELTTETNEPTSSSSASASELKQPVKDVLKELQGDFSWLDAESESDDEAFIPSAEDSSESQMLIKEYARQKYRRHMDDETMPSSAKKEMAIELAQRHAREEPSDWAYNWSHASGGTADPVAREGYSTLFFKETQVPSKLARAGDVDVYALKSVCMLCLCGWDFSWEEHDETQWADLLFKPDHLLKDTQPFRLSIYDNATRSHKSLKGIFILRQQSFSDLNYGGFMKSYLPGYGITEAMQKLKHNFHGPLVQLQSTSEFGLSSLKAVFGDVNTALSSYVAFLPHISEVLHADGDIVVSAVTGLGRQTRLSMRRSKRSLAENQAHKRRNDDGVSTRLSLRIKDDEIARCLLTWRNGDCAELGPNIEMLAVHQRRRGEGWLHKFYSVIEQFALSRWTMTGRTENGRRRSRIFASYLTGTEIETVARSNNRSRSISDKDFFFEYKGFDVRFDAGNLLGGQPIDEDAVKYIKPNISKTMKERQLALDGPETEQMYKHHGRLLCHYCARSGEEAKLLLCSRCRQVRYCSEDCSTHDWCFHKLWCGKTKDDLQLELVRLGGADKYQRPKR